MKYKVQLINRELGKGCLFGLVQGGSGKTYATSRYDARGWHVAELTPEEYERAAEDISRGWQRPLCRWVPRFIQDPASMPETAATPGQGMLTRESLARMPFFSLKKAGRDRGVAVEGVKKQEIIEAILEKQ